MSLQSIQQDELSQMNFTAYTDHILFMLIFMLGPLSVSEVDLSATETNTDITLNITLYVSTV